MSLTYDFPQNNRVADILMKLEKRQQTILNPDNELPMRDTYHRPLVGGSYYVPAGNSGSYPIDPDMDGMSVASYHPKQKYMNQVEGSGRKPKVGGVRSGGQVSGGASSGGARSGGRKSKFLKGLEDFGEYVAPVAKPVLSALTKKALEKIEGAGRKPTAGAKSKSARGALVSKLMKSEGMSLGQASKYIKQHNLK